MSTSKLTQLSSRIGALRESFGLTKKDFAKRLEVSSAYICQLESGERLEISRQLAKLISLEFGINMDWLITGKGSMNVDASSRKETVTISPDSTIGKIVSILRNMDKEAQVEFLRSTEKEAHYRKLVKENIESNRKKKQQEERDRPFREH